MKYDVFISYSSHDQKIVEGLCAYLEQYKIRCFVAYRDIPKGRPWASYISDALRESRMMVVVFSNHFNYSDEVDRELTIACKRKIPILTFRLSDEEFKGTKEYYLSNINWIDAFPNPEQAFGDITDSITKLLDMKIDTKEDVPKTNLFSTDVCIDDVQTSEIKYTSTNGEIVALNESSFNVRIISHKYDNGVGVITFDGILNSIEDDAFSNSFIETIIIPDSVTKISCNAFSRCSNLTQFMGKYATTDGRCLVIDGVLTAFAPSNIVEYSISDTVTSIGEHAFLACSSLTKIIIPDSVTSIGDKSFYGCSGIESIFIPASIETIGEAAFAYCSNLAKFSGRYVSEDGRSLIINGVLNSFAPFDLSEYTIPDSVVAIGTYAFAGCSSMINFLLPDSIAIISSQAFIDCSNLTSITIPINVTSIGYNVFCGCHNLRKVYCQAIVPPTIHLLARLLWGIFRGTANDLLIYIPMTSVNMYRSANGWKRYNNRIVGI